MIEHDGPSLRLRIDTAPHSRKDVAPKPQTDLKMQLVGGSTGRVRVTCPLVGGNLGGTPPTASGDLDTTNSGTDVSVWIECDNGDVVLADNVTVNSDGTWVATFPNNPCGGGAGTLVTQVQPGGATDRKQITCSGGTGCP